MRRFSRHPILAVLMLAALLGLGISSRMHDVTLAQDEPGCAVKVQLGE